MRSHPPFGYARTTSSRTWFIAGTSRGFGREWAAAVLERGDRVVGTARDPSTPDDLVAKYPDTLLALPLDVTVRDAVFATVKQAHDHFGELDIVVNNAGYGQFGMIEELSEQDFRDQLETDVFGSQSLAQEVRDFGIHVTLIEPGGFATDWGGSSARRSEPLEAYAAMHEASVRRRADMSRGNPAASAAAVMRIVDAEQPPLRCFFGNAPLGIAEADYRSRLETWHEWQPVALLAQG